MTDLPKGRVRNLKDCRRRNRQKARHRIREHHRLEVDHIAGHEHRRDLPIAVAVFSERSDHALKDEAAVADPLAARYKIAVCLDLARVKRQFQDRLALFRRERRAGFQLLQERSH